MSTVKELLGLTLSSKAFGSKADHCFSSKYTKGPSICISQLEVIVEKFGRQEIDRRLTSKSADIVKKFQTAFSNNTMSGLTRREIRSLVYALDVKGLKNKSIIESLSETDSALELITAFWRDGFLTGLLRCYLENWGTASRISLGRLHQRIITGLQNYHGKRPELHAIASNEHFFAPFNGDVNLGYQLALNKESICAATKMISVPDSWLRFSYFEGVILSFYEKSKNRIELVLPDLEAALNKHSSREKGSWTSLSIISKLILQMNATGSQIVQDQVKKLAFSCVGDPANRMFWIPPSNKTSSQKDEVNSARQILNEWITREFITVFFETCLDDPRRKAFWLTMAKDVKAFKVFGPTSVKNSLLRDQRIKDFVNERYQVSGGNGNTAAILMHVGSYALLEFSETGWAFYAFPIESQFCPQFDEYYQNISNLRNTGLPKLIRRNGRQFFDIMNEGSLSHTDGDLRWEQVFKYWMSQKIAQL